MIFQYPQISKTTQVLKDLIKVHNDRIGCYQAALNQPRNLDETTRELFAAIIAEGSQYRQQLAHKARQLDKDVRATPNVLGRIYKAWSDLKVSLICYTQKAILSNCLYNEEMALQTYRAALSKTAGLSGDVLRLLTEHENGLKRNCELLRCYKEMRHAADPLMYSL